MIVFMDNDKIERILDELAILNMSCFIVWHIGAWTEKHVLEYAAAAVVGLSFLICMFTLIIIVRIKDTKQKIKFVKRVINQSVFDVCFVAMCFIL